MSGAGVSKEGSVGMPRKQGKLLVRLEHDESRWDSLVDQCPLSTVYHRSGWLGAIEECEGVRIERVVCERGTDDGYELVCVWPIGLMKKGPLRVGGSPLPGWNTAYLGPLFTNGCGDRLGVIKMMMRNKPISNPSFIATRSMDADLDWSSLGFTRTRDFETYEIDLALNEDELFAKLKGTCRTRVRKGTKNGLVVRVEEDDGYLDDFWTMASDVFAKSKQRPPYSKKFLRAVHARMFGRGELLVTSAFHGDDRVATLIVPHDGKTGMYFAGGTFAEKLSLAPNNLLHWETMLACKRLGMSRYDFISNRGKPGKFKKTFNPEERVSCVHWERAKNPMVKWLRDRYEQRARQGRRVGEVGRQSSSSPSQEVKFHEVKAMDGAS